MPRIENGEFLPFFKECCPGVDINAAALLKLQQPLKQLSNIIKMLSLVHSQKVGENASFMDFPVVVGPEILIFW